MLDTSPETPARKAPQRSAKARSAASTSSMYKEAAAYVEFSDEVSDVISEPEDVSEDEVVHNTEDEDENEFDSTVKTRSGRARTKAANSSSNNGKGKSAASRNSPMSTTGKERAQRSKTAQAPSTLKGRKATSQVVATTAANSSAKASPVSTAVRRKASNIKFMPLDSVSTPSSSSSSTKATKSPSSSSARLVIASSKGSDPRQQEDQWTERYAPANIDEVAVHKGKIGNVREWLETYTSPSCAQQGSSGGAVLVLTGPAGSGKTTVLRKLAQEMDLQIIEWINSVNENSVIQRPTMPGQDKWRPGSIDDGQMRYLKGAHRYTPLVTSRDISRHSAGNGTSSTSSMGALATSPAGPRKKNIILIEDLPPISAYSSRKIFQDTISRFANSRNSNSSSVLVIIVSDVFSKQSTELLFSSSQESRDPALTIRTLLPSTILDRIDSGGRDNGKIKQIKFNPIAPTFMKKALRKLVDKEFRTTSVCAPDTAEMDQLIEIHDGDIRAVINALQFLCYLPTKKRKRYREAAVKLEEDMQGLVDTENIMTLGQDSSLGIFHAVAKVLYNRRDWSASPVQFDSDIVKVPPQARNKRRPPLRFNPEKDLIEKLPIDPDLYTLMLHQNYTRHMSSIDECLTAIEYLCVADQMTSSAGSGSNYTQMVQMQPYMTSLAVRGLLFAPTSAGPTASFSSGGSGQKKHWWPEMFAVNRTTRANDAMFSEVASDLAGDEAQGLSSGHITGPGFIPKAVIREELVPMLHKCANINPYMPIFSKTLRPSSKNFVRTGAGNFGKKVGMAKKEFGEGDEGFMEDVAPSVHESVSGNTDEIVSDMGGPDIRSEPRSGLSRERGGQQQQQQHQQQLYSQVAYEVVHDEDPIEDFSD
ncbi:Cell cycle checkpoint protein rad17 [Mortierella alpina]|uniref:Cell cycle checkpoint protein rad17 n=1 Tax=Mortierella alpina TaxID=64518 RepID=A0A9P6J5C4_MORAP|nr:Cell cycle checkpoint protein rad17 [Mortierella alpina]